MSECKILSNLCNSFDFQTTLIIFFVLGSLILISLRNVLDKLLEIEDLNFQCMRFTPTFQIMAIFSISHIATRTCAVVGPLGVVTSCTNLTFMAVLRTSVST